MWNQDYGPVVLAAPITETERRQVQILRELDAKRRAGPFWTGTKEDWARIEAVSGRNAVYDPFECAQKKSSKRAFRLADLATVKLGELHPSLCAGVSSGLCDCRAAVLPQGAAQDDWSYRRFRGAGSETAEEARACEEICPGSTG